MNVLLINPPGWQKHSYNLGLAYLAGSLRANNEGVLILDLNNHRYSDEKLRTIIEDFNPGVIGISVKTATANTSRSLFCKLKRIFPNIIYVAGGPHITLCGAEFMAENKDVDFCVIGEGEITFNELVKRVGQKEQVSDLSNIHFRKKEKVICNNSGIYPDVTKLPFPTFDHVHNMDFSNFMYPLLTSRGCPYGCIYCCVGLISGKKWRTRTPEDVVEELLRAKDTHQISSFEIMDDNFTLDMNRAKNICRLLIKKKVNLRWWCHNGLRADRLDQKLLHLMKKAGCQSIALGIESGDGKVFANINKGEKLSDISEAVRMIKKSGIKCVGYFIIGLPGDSIESTKRSIKFQRGLGLCDYKYNMLIPYPGTKIWDTIKDRGKLLVDIRGIYHFGDEMKVPFETDSLSKETLQQCYSLADNQEWMEGEEDLLEIERGFRAQYNRRIKKALFISNGQRWSGDNIKSAYPDAHIVRIHQHFIGDSEQNEYYLGKNLKDSCFDELFRLTKDQGCRILFDMSKRKLFLQKVNKDEKEYIRREKLPSMPDWDGSAKKYFATRLKNHSAECSSSLNGIIYKDNIALPFSPTPQWEKVPCGKVEGGLAFISLAACDENSIYTADYLTMKTESGPRTIMTAEGDPLFPEKIFEETDVLFCPESIHDFAFIVSRAKLNVLCDLNGNKTSGLKYKVINPSLMNRGFYIKRRLRRAWEEFKHLALKGMSPSRTVFLKGLKVCFLWVQIGFLLIYKSIKDLSCHIIRV